VTDAARPGPRVDRPEAVVLHSSMTGLASVALGVVLLVAFAVFAFVAVGVTVVSVVIGLAALAAVGVTVFDMPISSDFDAVGVTRRALLRHDRLRWDTVDRLSRQRRGLVRGARSAPTGGLTAVRGRRNFHLVDRMEGHDEWERLRRVLGDEGDRLGIERVARPPLEQPPTWLHRRAKWHPVRGGPGATTDATGDR
jgi:hypothetical protein